MLRKLIIIFPGNRSRSAQACRLANGTQCSPSRIINRRLICLVFLAVNLAGGLFFAGRGYVPDDGVHEQNSFGELPFAPPGGKNAGMPNVAGGEPSLSDAWTRVREPEEVFSVFRHDPDAHGHVKRFWRGRLQPALRELGEAYRMEGMDRFTLPLFDGEEILIAVRNFSAIGPDAGVFTGEVAGEPGSLVSLAYAGVAEAGSIHLPSRDQVFEIRAGPEGTLLLSEVDVDALGGCAHHTENAAEPVVPQPLPE